MQPFFLAYLAPVTTAQDSRKEDPRKDLRQVLSVPFQGGSWASRSQNASILVISLGLIVISDNRLLTAVTGSLLAGLCYVLLYGRHKSDADRLDGSENSSILATKYGGRFFMTWAVTTWVISYMYGSALLLLPSSFFGILQLLGLLDSVSCSVSLEADRWTELIM